jgi:hypothetical protein
MSQPSMFSFYSEFFVEEFVQVEVDTLFLYLREIIGFHIWEID